MRYPAKHRVDPLPVGPHGRLISPSSRKSTSMGRGNEDPISGVYVYFPHSISQRFIFNIVYLAFSQPLHFTGRSPTAYVYGQQ